MYNITLFHRLNTVEQKEKGVALLFVILLTSVLLLVAIGITNISYKQLVFSLEARDSDKAFFSADTGIECGLYLDKQGQFGGAGTSPSCNGTSLTIITSGTLYTFRIPIGSQCAEVTVDKAYSSGSSTDNTRVSSVGYNVNQIALATDVSKCVPSTFPASRVVTRALSTYYSNSGGGGGSGSPYAVTTNASYFDVPTSGYRFGGTVTGTGGSTITAVMVQFGTSPGAYTDSDVDTYSTSTFSFPAPGGCSVVYYRAGAENDSFIDVFGAEQTYDPGC